MSALDPYKQKAIDAAALRMPTFTYDPDGVEPPDPPQYKVLKIEEFMLEAANRRADLEHARMMVAGLLHGFVVEWEKLTGWEVNLPGGKRLKDATQNDVTAAKRNVRPDLWENISDAKHVQSLLSSQIRRLELDDTTASRAYTFIMGS